MDDILHEGAVKHRQVFRADAPVTLGTGLDETIGEALCGGHEQGSSAAREVRNLEVRQFSGASEVVRPFEIEGDLQQQRRRRDRGVVSAQIFSVVEQPMVNPPHEIVAQRSLLGTDFMRGVEERLNDLGRACTRR